MLALYVRDYLLKKAVAFPADMEGIASCPYPEFIQKLVDRGVCNRDDIDGLLDGVRSEYNLSEEQIEALKGGDKEEIIQSFIHFDADTAKKNNLKAYQNDHNLSDEEMEKLKASGELERFLPVYIFEDPMNYNRYINLVFTFLFKYVSDQIIIKPPSDVREYKFEGLSYQRLVGDYHIFMGFAGKGNSLLVIANSFGKKNFPEMNGAAYESVCELINCLNGNYASELSNENIALEIDVPGYCHNSTIRSNYYIYSIPLVIDGAEFDLLISFNTDIEFI